LQDALAEIYRCVARDQDEKLITRRGAPWPDRSIDVPLPHDYMAAYRLVSRLRTQVFDDQLRSLATELRNTSTMAIISEDEPTMWRHTRHLDELSERFDDRVTLLLRELF